MISNITYKKCYCYDEYYDGALSNFIFFNFHVIFDFNLNNKYFHLLKKSVCSTIISGTNFFFLRNSRKDKFIY